MRSETPSPSALVIVGRSSSHFTRIVRIFALELGVEHAFSIVRDLTVSDAAVYAGNPALKVPILQTPAGSWFGALNICRELERRSERKLRIVWPEDFTEPLLANAQELVLHAMATEVNLIMAKLGNAGEDGVHLAKMRQSLRDSVGWLDAHAPEILAGLPVRRDSSFLEVSLFCLTLHLGFRELLPTEGYANLTRFCADFGRRASAERTTYRFDV